MRCDEGTRRATATVDSALLGMGRSRERGRAEQALC
jgi:hypothetical protein